MPIIVVVDDEPMAPAVATRMLEAEGYIVIPLRSATVALEIFSAAVPCDLLIVDIRMPEMSGFDLAQRVRRHRPDLPVLYMSAYVETDSDGQGGFPHFLAKPFTYEELLAAVRRLLSAPAQARPETPEPDPAPTGPAPPRATDPPS